MSLATNPLLSIKNAPVRTIAGRYLEDKEYYELTDFMELFTNTDISDIRELIKEGSIKAIFINNPKRLVIPKKDFILAVDYFFWVWRNRRFG